jgi:YVTN family beta-propeller protein
MSKKFFRSVLRVALVTILLSALFIGVVPQASASADPTVISTIKIGDGVYGQIAIAVNPSTNRIYVANSGSDNLLVINGTTNAVVATVSVSGNPVAVAVNSNTNRIYVAMANASNVVSVIDGDSNTLVTTLNVGNGPVAVAVNPNTNRIYIANRTGRNISVIDGATNSIVATVNVDYPDSVCVNPITNLIYVIGTDGTTLQNNVSVIDGATNSVVAVVGSGYGYNYDIDVNPITNLIYATHHIYLSTETDVWVIDGATNSTLTTIDTGYATDLAANPSTNRIYVAKPLSNAVLVIDGASNTLVATLNVGDGPVGVAVNPKTNRIYVANYNDDTISVIQDVQQDVLGDTDNPIELRITENNRHLLDGFDDSAYEVYSNDHSYFRLLWSSGQTLDVPEKLKKPSDDNKYTKLARQNPKGDVSLFGDCVSAADALSDYRYDANWIRGNRVMDSGTTMTPGMVIATFLGPNNTYGASGHAAIFKGFTYDNNNNKTGFWVWDQNWENQDNLGEFGKHTISSLGNHVPTSDANDYYVALVHPSQLSETSTLFGEASAVQNNGVAVNISGSTAPDGTSVTISSIIFGDTSPSDTESAHLNGAQYYDVNVSSVSDLGIDVTAQISISNLGITAQSVMLYWFNGIWNAASDLLIAGSTIFGNIPVSALGGTPIVIGAPGAPFSQTWYLDNMTTGPVMEKTGTQSSSVDIEADSDTTWLSDQPAAADVTFTSGTWTIKLATDTDWSDSCSAQIGDFNPEGIGLFTAFNTTPVTGSYSDGIITITITTGGFVIQNDYLALKIFNNDSESLHTIATDGGSSLSSPTSDPGYPLPEMAAGLMLGLGLTGLVAYTIIKRKRDRAELKA